MKFIILSLLLSSLAVANPIKKAKLSPRQDEPTIPGTRVPIEKLNTAPTSPPIEEEDSEFRNTLKAQEQKEEQLEEKKIKIKP